MKQKLGPLSSTSEKILAGQDFDSISDKENKKYDLNIINNQPEVTKNEIEGIKSLGSDHFLNNFEDIRTLIKEDSIPRTLQTRTSPGGDQPKFVSNMKDVPGELLPLNEMIRAYDSKFTYLHYLKLCLFYSKRDP